MGDGTHPTRFEEQYPLDDIEQAIRDAPAPVALSAGVAERVGCSRQTARQKLDELHEAGRVEKHEASTAILWWAAESEEEEP